MKSNRRFNSVSWVVAVSVLLLLVGCSERPGLTGRIAFTTYREGQVGVGVVGAETDVLQLAPDFSNDYMPNWSPGAERLVFVSELDGNQEIYSANADGTQRTRLTANMAGDASPAWSPNGEQIAFLSNRDGRLQVCTMLSSGANQNCYPASAPDPLAAPAWSPDGMRIAFKSAFPRADGLPATDHATYTLAILDPADGSIVYPLMSLRDHRWADHLAWSPDGMQIAFSSNSKLAVINVDGSGRRTLYWVERGFVLQPAWSPDGRSIAFLRVNSDDTPAQLRLIDVDTQEVVSLASGVAGDVWHIRAFSWSPDGQYIAYAADGNPRQGIHLVSVDGKHTIQLTNGPDYNPVWSPAPSVGTP